MLLLGIDLGTTKVASVLVDSESGELLRVSSTDHHADLPAAHPWEHLQDPEALLGAARSHLQGAQELAAAHSAAIDGVTITGQMHGILYLDEHGLARSRLYTWLDGRAARTHPDGRSYAEVVSELTSSRLSPGFGLATHFANLAMGMVPEGAHGLCTILDYVTMRLAGNSEAVSDATTAASIGLFDPEAEGFDRDRVCAAGLDGIALPRVVPAGTRVGSAPGGVPLFAPVADNQASFLGSVSRPEESLLVNIGTGGQVSRFVPTLPACPPDLELRPFPGGGYLQVGAALCAGKAYAQLRAFFAAVLEAFGADPELVDYPRMNALAGSVVGEPTGGEGLRVDTRFAGTRSDGRVRGTISNISLENLTPPGLLRATLEGIVDELAGYAAAMSDPPGLSAQGAHEGDDSAHRQVVGSGNALRRNPLLRAAVARRFGEVPAVPRLEEEAALGAALCAAVGAGALPDYRSLGRFIHYQD